MPNPNDLTPNNGVVLIRLTFYDTCFQFTFNYTIQIVFRSDIEIAHNTHTHTLAHMLLHIWPNSTYTFGFQKYASIALQNIYRVRLHRASK